MKRASNRKVYGAAMTALVAGALALPTISRATPSTIVWTPATTYVQPFGVLHMTYDTYFRENALYPIDTGLELGVLPYDKLQAEVGFDFLMPINRSNGGPDDFPILLNFKIGSPDNALFDGSPSWSFGMYGIGFEYDVTSQNALHFELAKTFEQFGTPSLGVYYGANKTLFTAGNGTNDEQVGFMAGYVSPNFDLKDKIPGIDHVNFAWDLQTGINAVGGTGAGLVTYFTPAIDLITGPIWFFDNDIQPGHDAWMWTVQVDIDIDIFSSTKGGGDPAPAAP